MAGFLNKQLAEDIFVYDTCHFLHIDGCCPKDIRYRHLIIAGYSDPDGIYMGAQGILPLCMSGKCICKSFFQDECTFIKKQVTTGM